VVNVITKDPEENLGWLASTTWNDFHDSYSHLRWAAKEGKWSWRISTGYDTLRSSSNVIRNSRLRTNDFHRDWRFDGKAVHRPTDDTKWSFGIGHTHLTLGGTGASIHGKENGRVDQTRAFARLDRQTVDGGSWHAQWYGNYASAKQSSAGKFASAENDLEMQYNFTLADKHHLSVGGNVRSWYIANRVSDKPNAAYFPGSPYDEWWFGAFAIDRWDVTDRFVLEAQIRGDWYTKTHCDWSGRLTGMYALDADKRHVVRLAGAKAFRSPLAFTRKSRSSHVPLPSPPMPPGLYAVNLLKPARELDNEQTWAVEAGYTGKVTDWLTVHADLYYQRFENLIGYRILPDPLSLGRFLAQPDNIAGGDSYGAEVEVALHGKDWKLSAWYACNRFSPDRNPQPLRALMPAKHKLGLTGRVNLPEQWTINANYRFASSTGGGNMSALNAFDMGPSHRLDFTLAKRFLDGNAEILLGVSDVLNRTDQPVSNIAGSSAPYETPGRTFFLRLQIKF